MNVNVNNCLKCNHTKEQSEMVILKCKHSFCWSCINKYLQDNLKPKIKCPMKNCNDIIRDSQIRKVISEELICKYENMCLGNIEKNHKCLLPECNSHIVYTDSNIQYACPNCDLYNCITCEAAHNFVTCEIYQSLCESDKIRICQEEIQRGRNIYQNIKGIENRQSLFSIDEMDLLPNDVVFICSLCTMNICKSEGVKLRNCSHNFCKSCLSEHIKGTKKFPAVCPSLSCGNDITDREIQSVLPLEDLKMFQSKCNNFSKKKFQNYIQCQTPNCDSFYEFNKKVDNFICTVCKAVNCINCKTVHNNESCQQYKERMEKDLTMQSLKAELQSGSVMKCLGCQTLLQKVKGCNWIQCQTCSMELCWIRKMARWGPKGRGDTSDGCKCGVNGKPCHKDCTTSCTPHWINTNFTYRRRLRNLFPI